MDEADASVSQIVERRRSMSFSPRWVAVSDA
jgi:hypothetical protein